MSRHIDLREIDLTKRARSLQRKSYHINIKWFLIELLAGLFIIIPVACIILWGHYILSGGQ